MSRVGVVIPCYNEGKRLNLDAFSIFLNQHKDKFDFIFVNDGSTDHTIDMLAKFKLQHDDNSILVNLVENKGKAEATRLAILQLNLKYDLIAYYDSDLATPLAELLNMKYILDQHNDLKLVLASRIKRLGSKINRKRKRHLLGRIFSTFTSIILRLPVYDSQCGAKLFKKELINVAFEEPFLTKWLFDVEILARIRNKFPKEIETLLYEYPVNEWRDVAGSKLKLKHMLQVPYDLWRIHRKYNKKTTK